METNNEILFYSHYGYWGCFSNFYPCKFKENDIEYNCTEQYLMKKKQELFDPLNQNLSNKILSTINPAEIKKLGRSVKNFNQDIWNLNKFRIMKDGLKLKFSQNTELKIKLKDTNNKKLYEASPYDKIWGTGFDRNDTLKKIVSNDTSDLGENLLGKALEAIREQL